MRERLALYASVSTLVMMVFLSPDARAQKPRVGAAGGNQTSNAPGAQNANDTQGRHDNAVGTETIHGIIAGVTAEGEITFDYRTNTAVKSEGAFLTVVGSPVHSGAGERERRAATPGEERHAGAGARRHDVYIVWMTPKTKVCEVGGHSGTSQSEKKEVAFDKLEVGDRVEIQFNHHEDSAAHQNIHQSPQMRQRHGRHRTHVGYATAITILPPRAHDQSSSGQDAKSSEGAK